MTTTELDDLWTQANVTALTDVIGAVRQDQRSPANQLIAVLLSTPKSAVLK